MLSTQSLLNIVVSSLVAEGKVLRSLISCSYFAKPDSWQNIGALMNSKSDLSAFALEVSKKMGMFYRAPPLPVDLTLVKDAMNKGNHAASAGEASDDLPVDIASVAAMFDTKTP